MNVIGAFINIINSHNVGIGVLLKRGFWHTSFSNVTLW